MYAPTLFISEGWHKRVICLHCAIWSIINYCFSKRIICFTRMILYDFRFIRFFLRSRRKCTPNKSRLSKPAAGLCGLHNTHTHTHHQSRFGQNNLIIVVLMFEMYNMCIIYINSIV